jgi:mannose-6-phosphate isomerase
MEMYPLKLKPVFLEKIWGGTNLSSMFPEKGAPHDARIGESWELTVREDHSSVITNGPFAGRSLLELTQESGEQLAGKAALEAGRGRFPLLYKFLDANTLLSVQVHPDDDYALEHNNDLGKMEAWYILSAHDDARIVKGMKEGFGKEEFVSLLEQEKLEECLNMFSVSSGDLVFLPPKTLHTLGNGLVIFEIQQSSDVTYRAYDWGRVGDDGKPRELHKDQVFDVADFCPPDTDTEKTERPESSDYRITLVDCAYFVLEEAAASSPFSITAPDDKFISLTVIEGSGSIQGKERDHFIPGETLMIPPDITASVIPDTAVKMLVSYVPPKTGWFSDGADV